MTKKYIAPSIVEELNAIEQSLLAGSINRGDGEKNASDADSRRYFGFDDDEDEDY